MRVLGVDPRARRDVVREKVGVQLQESSRPAQPVMGHCSPQLQTLVIAGTLIVFATHDSTRERGVTARG